MSNDLMFTKLVNSERYYSSAFIQQIRFHAICKTSTLRETRFRTQINYFTLWSQKQWQREKLNFHNNFQIAVCDLGHLEYTFERIQLKDIIVQLNISLKFLLLYTAQFEQQPVLTLNIVVELKVTIILFFLSTTLMNHISVTFGWIIKTKRRKEP